MAVTLLEAAKRMRGEEIRRGVIELYASSSDLLRVIPFNDIKGNSVKYNQEQSLPGIGFRGLNEGYTESTGILNPVTESLTIAGGDLDVDNHLIRTMGEEQRSSQEALKVKALAQKWSNTFIKGDSTTSGKEFDGLQNRLVGPQLIDNGASSGGDVLSLAKLDELIDAVDDPQYLLMSKAMRRLLTAAARTPTVSGYVTYTKDEFGRRVTQYNDLPILIADASSSLYATLAFNEANPGGGSAVGTSIYCLSFGDNVLTGIQSGPMIVTDLGELQSKPSKRTRVEWDSGISIWHPRSAARLRGIKTGAVVA